MKPLLRIDFAEGAQDLVAIRELFLEYQARLGVDLGFQSFEAEVRGLPGDYAPPTGRLLLARQGGRPVGCIALRGVGPARGEMKRLFVRPGARGLGLGRQLVARLIDEARSVGYAELVLDTLPGMAEAQGLYLASGFRDIPPYRPNPIPGARFLGLSLDPAP
ncbi:MAG: GNAT family N-acetyltransferase [Holophagaceae bacterium]